MPRRKLRFNNQSDQSDNQYENNKQEGRQIQLQKVSFFKQSQKKKIQRTKVNQKQKINKEDWAQEQQIIIQKNHKNKNPEVKQKKKTQRNQRMRQKQQQDQQQRQQRQQRLRIKKMYNQEEEFQSLLVKGKKDKPNKISNNINNLDQFPNLQKLQPYFTSKIVPINQQHKQISDNNKYNKPQQNIIKKQQIIKTQQTKTNSKINKNQNKNKNKDKIYPFTKQDAMQKFRTKDQYQMAFDESQVIKYLTQQLQNMSQYGFEFGIKYNQKISKFKILRRKIYVKFQCPDCIESNGKKRAWTSILGNMQIQFFVSGLRPHQRKMKQPIEIVWNVYTYFEDCKDCRKPATVFVFKAQLQGCGMQFCRIVADIINGVPPPEHVGNRQKLIQNHHHIQELCQACRRGVCFNMKKQETQQKRNGQN